MSARPFAFVFASLLTILCLSGASIQETPNPAREEAARLSARFKEALQSQGEKGAQAAIEAGRAGLLALPGGHRAYAALAFAIGDEFSLRQPRLAAWAYQTAFREGDALGLRESAGNALFNAAIEFSALGDFHTAVRIGEQTLGYRKVTGNLDYVHQSLTGLAEDATSWRRFDMALGYAGRAHSLAKRLEKPQLIGDSCTSLGNLYWYLGEFGRSEQMQRSALEQYKKEGDTHHIVAALGNLGATYESLGQFGEARSYYTQARRLVKEADLPGRAMVLSNLGTLLWHEERFKEALPLFQRALELRLKGDVPANQVQSYSNLGSAYRGLKMLPEASGCYEKGLKLAQQLGFTAYESHLEANLGDLLILRRSPVAARPHLERSMRLLEVYGQPQERAECLRTIADMELLEGRQDLALSALRRAIELYEDASQHVSEPASVGVFLDANQRGLYGDLASLLARRGLHQEALLISDRGRGQGLYRQIGLTQRSLGGLMTRQEAAKLEAAAAALSEADVSLQGAVNRSGDPDGDEAKAAIASRERVAGTLRTYESALSRKYPSYLRIKGGRGMTGSELSSLLRRHPDTLYLEWCSRDRETLLFAASSKGGIRTFRLPLSREALQRDVSRWRQAIATVGELTVSPRLDRAEMLRRESQVERQLATKLLRSIIEPAISKYPGLRRLVLVADGPLMRAPIAALRTPQGQRLIERYAISSAVSLSSLTWPKTRTKADRLVAIGYDALAGRGLPPLAAAFDEARMVASQHPRGVALRGSSLTTAKVLRELGRCDIAHFATHAIPNDRQGLRSQILFGPGTNGILEASEVLLAPIRARLVVMSACSTGVGQERTGEGQLGLAWAFQAAGSRSAVISQWALSDRVARRMMGDFYAGVRRGLPLDMALQSAAKAEMKRSGPDVPYLWANYLLVGSSEPLNR